MIGPTDWFTTILAVAGVSVPNDRIIDGLNQLDWLTGKQPTSNRVGYLYWMGPEIYGVRWRNFKLVLVEQRYMFDAAAKLPSPRLVNLTLDPHERERVSLPHLHTWVAYHAKALIAEYEASIEREPLIPMGAPLDHCPAGK